MECQIHRALRSLKTRPGFAEKYNQECDSAQTAYETCFRQRLHIIVMRMVNHEAVVKRLVPRKGLRECTQTSSQNRMIKEHSPCVFGHFGPARFGYLKLTISREALENRSHAEPNYQSTR